VAQWDPAARRLELSLQQDPAGGFTPGGGTGAAGDFALPDLDGTPVALSGFRGKKVLYFCWASW
jgi:hypothetical protein